MILIRMPTSNRNTDDRGPALTSTNGYSAVALELGDVEVERRHAPFEATAKFQCQGLEIGGAKEAGVEHVTGVHVPEGVLPVPNRKSTSASKIMLDRHIDARHVVVHAKEVHAPAH